ncbi:MAG TPA: hypothetical protein VFU88_11385 [Ktedonobacterales bacterium]|nr:hypothetical protein [Ktedonobacterales bacterium]
MDPREGDLTMPMPPRREASLPPASLPPQPATEPFPTSSPIPNRHSPRSVTPGYWAPQGYYYAPPPPPAQAARQAPREGTQQRMPKVQALALTQRLKRWLIGGTLAAFVSLAALAAAHATGVTAQAGATSTGSGDTSAQPANNDDGGGFFGTQPGFGSPGFGSGGGSQSPMSGTGTS